MSDSGYRGVSQHPERLTWYGRVTHFGKIFVTRYFDTPEEANDAVLELRNMLHTRNAQDRSKY